MKSFMLFKGISNDIELNRVKVRVRVRVRVRVFCCSLEEWKSFCEKHFVHENANQWYPKQDQKAY